MEQPGEIAVFGAGGHAKVVLATLVAAGRIPTVVYEDDDRKWGGRILGVPIRPTAEAEARPPTSAIIAVGSNPVRRLFTTRFPSVRWVTAVHPRASVHDSVKLGDGTVVFAGAVIQPDSTVGRHAIINTSATVDHDCEIGDFVHVAPGAHLAGGVRVGNLAFLGIGAVVTPGVRLADGVTLGAGAVAINDLQGPGAFVGVPAKRIG